MRAIRIVLLCFWLCTYTGAPASAHKPSDSYLSFTVEPEQLRAQWDIALRDLDYAVGLDSNADGAITWGELRAREPEVTAYALSRLQVEADGKSCPLTPDGYLVDSHSDGAYAVLQLKVGCPRDASALDVRYNLFFDLDPQHRGLLSLKSADQTRTAIFSPTQSTQHLEVRTSALLQFLDFAREGIWHIWIGFDHILFLLTLLLPAVLERRDGKWQPVKNLPAAFANVLKIVTAFTIAHSITLTLATLGVVQLPSRLVESVIAASVILAALNNLVPLVKSRLWAIAFVFGLIHGFGFASVLADLNLPQSGLLLALFGFNVGVELGQLAIVAAFLPVAFLLRNTWFYRQITLTGGSIAVAVVASVWLAERVFDWKVLPF